MYEKGDKIKLFLTVSALVIATLVIANIVYAFINR